ncbi:Fcf2 domain-containing protein [Aspergillus novofumigatus IBT 16806]|uniref:Putative nucleolus protein required for cell viability n=1 Tax=Aspergillus novofumigatus (strain IBT 16806) TaxID=1392255 RepID=A0A2I1CDR6_ASPN1|nr:putative nucleolus protein required for cell viability [Aspergillus novofumigatus IBT 16806]PKX95761.1 putative nucleolus protein required for cell viability [Aspergillus novofumigatus IBT 16806]
MQVEACGKVALHSLEAGALNDQDIEQLLLEAESRLQTCKVQPTSTPQDPAVGHSGKPFLNIPKLTTDSSLQSYIAQRDDVALADTKRIIDPLQMSLSNKSLSTLKTQQAFVNSSTHKEKPTAGADWFHLPKTELTTQLKRDIQLIRMRSVLDPKRHYKKEGGKAQPPKYSQLGTIIEGPTEFFSGRIAKKDRKKTFVEDALALERETKRFASKYREIQTSKQSGKRSFYSNLRAKRNRQKK